MFHTDFKETAGPELRSKVLVKCDLHTRVSVFEKCATNTDPLFQTHGARCLIY